MNIAEKIKALPNNGRLEIYAGGRDDVKTGITTPKLKAFVERHKALLAAAKEVGNYGKPPHNSLFDGKLE